MQARSAYFDATVAGPHTLLTQADILAGGKVIASGLPVASGSVSGNRSQFARRTCSVVIGDPAYKPTGQPGLYQPAPDTLYPSAGTFPGSDVFPGSGSGGWWTPGDLLAPYGNEIRLFRGAMTPVGPELICVGTFGIRSVEFNSGSGAFDGIAVTGIDRSKVISEARFPYPRSSSGFSVVDMIRQLILEVLPWVEVRVAPGTWDAVVPQVTWRSDRDQAITDLAASIGAEVFCDPLGAFVIQPIPSPVGDPVFKVTSGAGGVLVSARRSLSRDGVYNGVVARGSSTSTTQEPPVSDLVVDNDPTSPTYWGGNFGQIVGFYDSSLLLDKAQCNNAARAMLLNNIGAARSLDYATAVNPALEPGDVVAVTDPDTGITELHLQDQLTIPLDANGVMTAQTRSTLSVISPPVQQAYAGSLS